MLVPPENSAVTADNVMWTAPEFSTSPASPTASSLPSS